MFYLSPICFYETYTVLIFLILKRFEFELKLMEKKIKTSIFFSNVEFIQCVS